MACARHPHVAAGSRAAGAARVGAAAPRRAGLRTHPPLATAPGTTERRAVYPTPRPATTPVR
ncbi:hypothetical protein C3489_33895 [Streptomyces sp. Ru71]|nr:hypothetical protein C3489_33895 [Streptomyces sp. Ru71]